MPINKIPQNAFSNDDMVVNTFTATAGQTAFTLTKQVSVNSVLVHINDVIQQPTVDYTVSGTTLTLTAGATVGDDVRVRILSENPLGVAGGGGRGRCPLLAEAQQLKILMRNHRSSGNVTN